MEKNELADIIKAISSMSSEEQQELIKQLQTESPTPEPKQKKNKVRRKKYKKGEQQAEIVKSNISNIKIVKRNPPEKNPLGDADHAGRKPAALIKLNTGKRENLFEKSSLINAEQQDIKIDKLLHSSRETVVRNRQLIRYEVKCSKCESVNFVSEDQVFFMPNGEYSYTCNKCVGR